MNKVYDRIQWENYPSEVTPLNEMNLNKMDAAVDALDDRVIYVDTVKAGIDDISSLVQSIIYKEDTGTFTVTKKNGESFSIDTKLEKLAVNFAYNAQTQQLIITLDDGTKQNVDLSALITQYEFLDTDTVAFSVDAAGRISAIIKDACIQEKHLQSDYLGNIKVEVAKANASQTAAALSETNAAKSAETAKSYAVGGTATRENEDTDNAKYYKEETQKLYNAMGEGYVTGIKGDAETEYRAGDVNITPEDIGVEAGANKTSVDVALSSTSMNPVQNKVVAAALDGKMPVYSYNGGTFDADDLTSPAIHLINSGGTNLPASCSGGVLLVDGSSQTTQYFFPLYNGDNRIHTRYKYHGTKWTDWEILGLSTSQSTAITTAGTYALDAVQNNASVSGTLANKINPVTSALILATGFNKESGQLFKINNTVTLNGRYSRKTNFKQSDFTTIGTLPSGFRPTTNIYSPATVCNTTTVYPAIVRILTTGEVQVYTNNLGQYSELCVTFLA